MRTPTSAIWSEALDGFHRARAELLPLLLSQGILRRSASQPVRSRDGADADWMLDSLAVTLGPKGAELAARCLLELLAHFDGRQLAAYGFTAIPLLQACILQSGGRYHGLLVRRDRKPHGSSKLVEGPLDPNEPTIIIDDSVSSGISMTEACRRLHDAGVRVEGGVSLMRFGWYGGFALMQERGYHVEAVFDVWDHIIGNMADEPQPLDNPSKWFPRFRWSGARAPEGLHPADLARLAIREYVTTGELPRPPERLNAGYDSSGGVWISLRSKKDARVRYARDGFWHFPDEPRWTLGEDVVRAALRTAEALPAPDRAAILEASHLAVTFFSPLEPCAVGDIDNDRYGIVVRSLERKASMGGALPRMPGIRNEWEQFQHARVANAGLLSFEPWQVYRHDVTKAIEPGALWQPTGVPASGSDRAEASGGLATRARDLVCHVLFGLREEPPPGPDEWPVDAAWLYVSVFFGGRLRGAMGCPAHTVDALPKLVAAALADERYADVPTAREPGEVSVIAAGLHGRLELGRMTVEEVADYFRCGQQALGASDLGRDALLLPSVAVMNDWSARGYAQAVMRSAGLEEPCWWTAYECDAWLADPRGAWPLEGAFPAHAVQGDVLDLAHRLAQWHIDHLLASRRDPGSFHLYFHPFTGVFSGTLSGARLAHIAWVLARASSLAHGSNGRIDRRDEVRGAAECAVDALLAGLRLDEAGAWIEAGDPPSIAETSFVLLALCSLGRARQDDRAARIAATLWACIDRHGRFRTHRDLGEEADPFQDYCPGQAMLALAIACRDGVAAVDEPRLARAFRFYRHRFRFNRGFGQVSWLLVSLAAWWGITNDDPFADLAYEVADWILEFQQTKTGGFITGHQSDCPGYTTALYLEGLAAAARLAGTRGDHARRDRYIEAAARALRFLDRLVIQPRDAAILPNPTAAVGAVRASEWSSEVRSDFVQHALIAVLEFQGAADSRGF